MPLASSVEEPTDLELTIYSNKGDFWKDSGTSDETPEYDITEQSSQATLPGLVSLYLAGLLRVSERNLIALCIGAWVVTFTWLFIQDNAASKVDTVEGLQIFVLKFTFVSVFFAAVVGIFTCYALLRGLYNLGSRLWANRLRSLRYSKV
jgi:hypothetical protein